MNHLGSTGVAPPNLQKLDAQQRQDLANWIKGLGLDHVDEVAFVDDVAFAVWLYPALKFFAETDRASIVIGNLEGAITAAERLLDRLNTLDGKSLFYLSVHTRGRSLNKEAAHILMALSQVRNRINERPAPGRRPMPERVQFACLLLRALRRHTSAEPKTTPGKVFETLLRRAFWLAGEEPKALNNLAAKALAADLHISEDGFSISLPK